MNYALQNILRLVSFATLAAGGALRAEAPREQNFWPGVVTTPFGAPEGQVEEKAVGPLLFSSPGDENRPERFGFRPFWVETVNQKKGSREVLSLYPIFRYEEDAAGARWSLFSLIRKEKPKGGSGGAFEVWPFLLRRNDPAKGDHYTALFPLYGEVTNRFGLDRWDFALFPLYSRSEKSGRVITQTPWPIFRRIEGAGHSGLELWPLYGWRGREKDYERSFYLWPLGYSSTRWNDDGSAERAAGFLPFYAEASGPGHRSKTFIWPFFGFSERTAPKAYRQNDYLWPLWVQGRGEERYVNRWAPFYTHSKGKGREKHWYFWPLLRHETVRFADMQEEDTRFLFFVYRSTVQSRPEAPAAGTARRTHFWPLVSSWDNGRGQRQVQFLSPLEPAFPNNEAIRASYSPLFALYRLQQTAPGTVRHSALWDFITLTRDPEATEWHVGPLLDGRTGTEGRYALLHGLFGFERKPEGWRPFVFKFQRQATAATKP